MLKLPTNNPIKKKERKKERNNKQQYPLADFLSTRSHALLL